MEIKNNRLIRGLYFLLRDYFGVRRKRFGHIGHNVIINPPYHVGNPNNVFISDNTGIGCGAYISATNAKLIIKGNCSIGEHLTVHTGNHARILGKFITNVHEENKPDGYDKDIIIEEDVWIGSNVTLLSGVTIGRGSTIAAGSVVNKDLPPYALCAGIPARVKKMLWGEEQIIKHEEQVYVPEKRMTQEEIIALISQFGEGKE